MLVKDIIKKSAKILEFDDVIDYYSTNPETIPDEVSEKINKLLLAINLVNNTIASLYFEIVGSKVIDCKDGVIPYSSITTNEIVEIKNIYENNGLPIKYKVLSDGVHVASGLYKIVYSYLPSEVDEDDNINYYTKVNSTLFSYGVVAEYLFLIGNINDAYIWDNKFKDEILSLIKTKKNINMPIGRWY